MEIYHFDKDTKEFMFTTKAEANPEETRIKGEFVPLIPMYATILKPPVLQENEAAVFDVEAGKWLVKPDYRKNFKICDEYLNIQDIKQIGEIKEGYLVENKLAELIKQNPEHFKIKNGKVIEKTKAEIEAETIEKQRQQRIAEIKTELENIDRQKVRAITEPEIKDIKTGESWLEYYNNQAKALREELQKLESEGEND